VAESNKEAPNRRAAPRFKLDVRVICMTGEAGTSRGAIGRTADISEGGIAVLLPAHLDVGKIVELELTLPGDSRPLTAKVVIRSRQSYRYRCEFLALGSAQREHIKRACKTLEMLEI
jgi:c-di-GMP-binding flagellar brake protein YcgR